MADNERIVTAIIVVINECMGILGCKTLDRKQRAVLGRVLAGMARKTAPMQKPFNRQLVDAMRIQDEAARRRSLASLLGVE